MKQKIVLISLILVIGIFELYVFNEMIFPKVSNHYKLYYIDKKLISWSHGKGIFYSKGIELNHKNIKRFLSREGWSGAEKTFRWNNGKIASIFFEVTKDVSYTGKLNLNFGTHKKQKIIIYLNNQKIAHETFNTNDINVTFLFNPKILKVNDINIIKLEFPNAQKPNNLDSRILAMSLKALSIE